MVPLTNPYIYWIQKSKVSFTSTSVKFLSLARTVERGYIYDDVRVTLFSTNTPKRTVKRQPHEHNRTRQPAAVHKELRTAWLPRPKYRRLSASGSPLPPNPTEEADRCAGADVP